MGVLTKIKFEGEVMVAGSFALWCYSGLRHEWDVREGRFLFMERLAPLV